jgi:hypothetical protein
MSSPERSDEERGLFSVLVGNGLPPLMLVAGSLVLAGGFAVFLALTGEFLPHDIRYLGMSTADLCSVEDCRVERATAPRATRRPRPTDRGKPATKPTSCVPDSYGSYRPEPTRSARNSSQVRRPIARSGATLTPARTARAARPGSLTGRIGRRRWTACR